MAQKKTLSKNRKRKFLKKLDLVLSLRNAFVNLHRASQPKPPTLTPGGIMSEIKPWTHREDMAPFFTGASAIHEAILVGIDRADPKQFAIAYNNEAGTIGVIFAPKADTKSNIDDIKKHITNENIIAALPNHHSKFVWPHQDTADY